jgi:hypothetical protein
MQSIEGKFLLPNLSVEGVWYEFGRRLSWGGGHSWFDMSLGSLSWALYIISLQANTLFLSD